jgi:predicted dehydrogenase
MSQKSTRREFIKQTTALSAAFWVGGAGYIRAEDEKSPNERVRFGCIGVGGKGGSDSADAGKYGDVVAICDVDDNTLEKAAARFPNAKKFNDFRKMLEEMGDGIDAVTVSTPDHTHAPASAMAMKMGKACFTQKPLTHSVFEARRLGEIAREMGVATQMGNQGTATDGLRRGAAVIQAGAIGDVKEIHVWTNRPIWAQGGDRPEPSDPPAHLNWDLFLGPAPERPYAKGYHPFAWRGWWDFGTGALGDMACHTMNLAFAACDLRDPISISAETPGHNGDSFPKSSTIRYEFASTESRPAITMYWYDGGRRPDQALLQGEKMSGSGLILIGEKGSLYSPNDYGASWVLLPKNELVAPDVEIVRSPNHFEEFVNAIKGGPAAMSNFPDYAGPLTETVLLGNLAVWSGKTIEWDAKNLKALNCPEVDPIIKREYRKYWEL